MTNVCVGCAAALAVAMVASAAQAGEPGYWVLLGGQKGEKKGGAIWRARFDAQSGKLSAPEIAAELPNPSYQVLRPDGRVLYSTAEVGKFAGEKGGGVAAFSVDPATGALTKLNEQPAGGAWTCHLSVDPTARCILGANYGGGNVFAMPLKDDGRLGERASLIQHEGKGANEKRQKGPHAHSINPDPTGRFALACDLGIDKVLIYRLDAKAATLTLHGDASTAGGAGPRHLAWHPGGTWCYVINELDSTMDVFAWDADTGKLTGVQTLSTLPEGFDGESYCAEVQVHPSGKFVYGSNRGHNSIAVFSCDPATGKLTLRGTESVRGNWPRNFRLDPTGRWLLCANRRTNNVTVFRIDTATGALTYTDTSVEVPGAVCVKFLERAE